MNRDNPSEVGNSIQGDDRINLGRTSYVNKIIPSQKHMLVYTPPESKIEIMPIPHISNGNIMFLNSIMELTK
jgi:hypothetical protein